MSKITLTYWPVQGLGAAPRMALHAAGVDFDDVLVTDVAKWFGVQTEAIGEKNPLVNLPYLTLSDGRVITQSNAVLRHIARTCALYGADETDMSRVDEVLDVIKDFRTELLKLAYGPAGNVAENQKGLAEESVPYYFGALEKFFATNKTQFLAADSVTVADFALVAVMEAVTVCFDGSMETVFAAFPLLLKHFSVVKGLKQLEAYHASPMSKAAMNGPTANFSPLQLPK